jgi:phosphatidylglycerol:prolipoprotein diacylglycerol transferase
MLPMLQIGPLNLQTPALVLLLAVWLGNILVERNLPTNSFLKNPLSDALLWSLVGAMVFARLGYSLAAPSTLMMNPLTIFSLNTYQLDLRSGVLGFFLALLIFAARKNLKIPELLDALAPFFLLIQIGLSLSTFLSGGVYGSTLSLPWAIYIGGAFRHPIQIYEVLLLGIPGLFFLRYQHRHNFFHNPGTGFLTMIAVSALVHVIVIPFRGDSGITFFATFRLEQVAAWLLLTTCLLIMRKMTNPVQLIKVSKK